MILFAGIEIFVCSGQFFYGFWKGTSCACKMGLVSSRSVLCPIKLLRKYKKSREHMLVACEVRQSGIRNAGRGVFLREAAFTGEILLRYGGRKISLKDADRLIEKVN